MLVKVVCLRLIVNVSLSSVCDFAHVSESTLDTELISVVLLGQPHCWHWLLLWYEVAMKADFIGLLAPLLQPKIITQPEMTKESRWSVLVSYKMKRDIAIVASYTCRLNFKFCPKSRLCLDSWFPCQRELCNWGPESYNEVWIFRILEQSVSAGGNII